MIKWVVLVVGSSSIKTDFNCVQNQSCVKYECNRTVVKYHDTEIAVIQTDIDNNNDKYKFEVCSITKLKDGGFHYDGSNLESFMGEEEPDMKSYDIELRNRTTQVLACKEEYGVFCIGRKCNTRLQAIFDEVQNPCFANQRTCARFEPIRENIPYNFNDIIKYKSELHKTWLQCIQLTSPRLTSKSDLVSSCLLEQGSHDPSVRPTEHWESLTIVPEIDWIENESSPKLCMIANSFSYCKTEMIQEYHTPMVGIYHFNSRGFCKELVPSSPCPENPEYKFVCRYDNCNNYAQYSTADWYSIPDCKPWDNWPEYNQHQWPDEINLQLNKTEKLIPLRKICGNDSEGKRISTSCQDAINQKFICSDINKPVIGNFCSNNAYGAINWSELKALPKMSILNQTEACYLSLDNLNDVLICRGDFCLSKIREDNVTDILSCETTVLELESDSTNLDDNPSTLIIYYPYILTLLIIIFMIIILAIVIKMQRSKNRNNTDNFFTSSHNRNGPFCQIETTDKYVENTIRKAIRECYPTASYPAYQKQLFLVECNVRETELYDLEDVAITRKEIILVLVY